MSGQEILRIVPNGDLAALMQHPVSPQAAFVRTRLSGDANFNDVAALTGLSRDVLASLLEELERIGAVTLTRAAPPVSPPAAAPQPARPRPAAAGAVDLTTIVRIQPSGDLLALVGRPVSAAAGFVLSRLDGPLTPAELAALTAMPLAELAVVVQELLALDVVRVFRDPNATPPPPAAPTGTPAAPQPTARNAARPPLADVAAAFGSDPFAGAAPLQPETWPAHLLTSYRQRRTVQLLLGYNDGQVWALRLIDGFPSAYRTNRGETSWRIGNVLRQMAGVDQAHLDRALAEQGNAGAMIGEMLVRYGLLTPGEVERGLVMQMKWILRELFLLGPPARAATTPNWPGPRGGEVRFAPAPWLHGLARQRASGGVGDRWRTAWARTRLWTSVPAPALGMQRSQLSVDERAAVDRFSDPRGNELPTIGDAEFVLIAAGLLEPVATADGAPARCPAWATGTGDPFELLGLHWSSIGEEVAAAAQARRDALPALKRQFAEIELTRVQSALDAAEKLLGDGERRRQLLAAIGREHREASATLFAEQAIAELHARGDEAAAMRLAERIINIAWDLPGPLSCAHYVSWHVSRHVSARARQASAHRRALETLATQSHAPAEADLYMAYALIDEGQRALAAQYAKRAVQKNPYLREARRLLGES